MGGVGRASASAARLGAQPLLTHQPLDPLAATANALRRQLLMHAGTAVALLAGSVDGADLHSKALISPLSLPGASPLRCIETGTRDPKHPAHHQDRKLAPMRL